METFGGLIITVDCCCTVVCVCAFMDAIRAAEGVIRLGDDLNRTKLLLGCIVFMTCDVPSFGATKDFEFKTIELIEDADLNATVPAKVGDFFIGTNDGIWNLSGVVDKAALFSFTGDPLRKLEY